MGDEPANLGSGMAAKAPSTRLPRAALWLACLAVAAHLGLGWAGAFHHARALAAGAGTWAEVCTPTGIERLRLPAASGPSQDEPPPELRLGQCAVCSAAAVSVLPAPSQAAAFPASPPCVLAAVIPHSAPAAPLALRPPPRAPPRFS